jgi:crotonobetainyl-CoA:carnitine CoA-transferase CaiB-like acyl-CoA transferase
LQFEGGTGYGEISVSSWLSIRVDMTPVDKQNPFNAIKFVECGEGVSAAFENKLLADLGAEVIKVELAEGEP